MFLLSSPVFPTLLLMFHIFALRFHSERYSEGISGVRPQAAHGTELHEREAGGTAEGVEDRQGLRGVRPS